ncbi:MAG: hypothetical protein V7636_2077 [Actinomycetota bacterium]
MAAELIDQRTGRVVRLQTVVHEALPLDRLRRGLRAWDLADADLIGIVPGVTSDVFLVMRGDQRWVAKFAYHHRAYFEVGLRVSEIVHRRLTTEHFQVAVSVRTTDGDLTELVEWPVGNEHPLAVISYVRGDPLTANDADDVDLCGDVCGRVHAALLDVAPDDVGIAAHAELDDVQTETEEATQLDRLCIELDNRTREMRDSVRHAVSVWDGPDIRRADRSIGVLDFGHCGWHPLVHVIANRSLNVALSDESRLEPFLEAVERHVPLTTEERDAIPLYRLLNAAIYARWVASERVARCDPSFNEHWFNELTAMLHRELPRIG